MKEPSLPGAVPLPDAALEPLSGTTTLRQRMAAYRAIWPVLALLVGEVLAVALFAPPRPGELTPLTMLAVGGVVLLWLLPVLLRPSTVTNLIGCLAVALASVLWRTPYLVDALPSLGELAPVLNDNAIRLSLLNIVLLAPLTLHLAARFPLRSSLPMWRIGGYYLLIVGIALMTFALPLEWRQHALVVLFLSVYAGFGIAAYQLLRAIRLVQPTYPRAAQQARLLLLSLLLAELPLLLFPVSQSISLFISYEVIVGAQIILPIGMAYAILRHDLFGFDTALRRALDYAIVSFGLLVIYFGLTALLTQLSRSVGGTWGFVATVLSVIAAAAAFTPLRRITQRVIDQVFYPERLRFEQTISAARATLAQVVQRDAVVRLFEDDLPRQLGAAWAKLVLRPSFNQPEAATQQGVWSVLLMVGGQPIGCYWLGPRQTGLPYTLEEQEQLQILSQQAALALAYAETFDSLVQLNQELEERVATRTEHVLAQQRELATFEERQRLARDLHDSVKQTLFSLGLGIRSAHNRLRNDPETAATLLKQQEQLAIQAQAEMGDLLAQLRTPAADTVDLVELLSQHRAWLKQQHGLQVVLSAPAALVLPEPVARELMQVAKEALHNVLRHSGATTAQLTLASEQGQLTLLVEDCGCGFDSTAAPPGHGLHSMRERIMLLGGTLTIQSAPGKGTTVWAQIPPR